MVILFDGVCNLCNGFVSFIIKRDRKDTFRFAALQSSYGKGFLQHFQIANNGLDTVLLYDGKNIIARSDATIRILSSLGGIWKAAVILNIIPGFIRNSIYNYLAKRRYSLFGKRDSCMVPNTEIKNRFLDEKAFNPDIC